MLKWPLLVADQQAAAHGIDSCWDTRCWSATNNGDRRRYINIPCPSGQAGIFLVRYSIFKKLLMKHTSPLILILSFLIFSPACHPDQTEWKVYGGSKANTHYSSLKEIDTANVSQLQ